MQTLLRDLRNRGFISEYFKNEDDLLAYLANEIPEGKSKGFGGSKTLEALGLYEFFQARGNEVFWHWKGQDLKEAERAKVYFTSANALSKEPALYFVDGNGNRVKNIMDDDKDVYVICGTNKLVEDREGAIRRIEDLAAPTNAKRFKARADDISNYSLEIRRSKAGNIRVLLIEGAYGY